MKKTSCVGGAILLIIMTSFGQAHEAPKSDAEKQTYIDENLQIFETEATTIDTFTEEGVPALRFSIKNIGEETISRLKVVAYFLDESGLPFFEKDYLPITDSAYSLSDSKPLKPNYTFRLDRGKYYTIENLGDEWSGKVRIEITEIEFEE